VVFLDSTAVREAGLRTLVDEIKESTMTEAHLDETRQLLGDTEEALVLGYHLDESTAEFELVCEVWAGGAGADRAFGHFQFSGVQKFERKPGLHKPLRNVGSTFVARAVTGTWVIQAVRIRKFHAFSAIEVSLGGSFGSVAFRYEVVTHQIIQLYAKAKGSGTWDYFEVGTDRPVDFENPFDRSWAKAG
jgi:hypothetical protein